MIRTATALGVLAYLAFAAAALAQNTVSPGPSPAMGSAAEAPNTMPKAMGASHSKVHKSKARHPTKASSAPRALPKS